MCESDLTAIEKTLRSVNVKLIDILSTAVLGSLFVWKNVSVYVSMFTKDPVILVKYISSTGMQQL